MGEECRHCKKWKEHCRRFEEHYYWDHVDARKMHFSKSMTGDFSSCMIIPKKFIDHFKGELLETIELKVPSGDKWHVELKKTFDGVVLDCGWKDFVVAHGIQENDTLMFKYDGCSSFLVLMFEQGGCEKAASHCAKKRNPVEDLCAMTSGKNVRHSCYGSSPRHNKQAPPLTVDQKSSRANRDVKEKHVKRRLNSKRIYRRKKNIIDSKRIKSLNVQETEVMEGTVNVTNEVTLAKWCNPKDFIISRKARLTDAEKNIVLRFAETIHTDRPSFVSIMVPCSIIKRFFMTIPIDFATQYLPRGSGRILLQLPDKESSWPVHCLVQGHSVGFSSGWKEFAHDNKLKVGDICLFELLEAQESILMTVHIKRIEVMLP